MNTYVADNKIDKRPFRGDWCNQNNAGIGARPTDQPLGASSPIEAYVWIKPPGESDGDYPTATHAHGDPHCDPNGTNTDGNGGTYSTGSIPGFDVPAGQWFAAEFQMLVKQRLPGDVMTSDVMKRIRRILSRPGGARAKRRRARRRALAGQRRPARPPAARPPTR